MISSKINGKLYANAGDTAGIGDTISRVTAIASNTTRGTGDANVLAGYEFSGVGLMARKDLPSRAWTWMTPTGSKPSVRVITSRLRINRNAYLQPIKRRPWSPFYRKLDAEKKKAREPFGPGPPQFSLLAVCLLLSSRISDKRCSNGLLKQPRAWGSLTAQVLLTAAHTYSQNGSRITSISLEPSPVTAMRYERSSRPCQAVAGSFRGDC